MNPVSLESLISSGCFHLAAASLLGHWLLSWHDRRGLAAVPKVLLSGVALAASLRSVVYTEETSQRSVWAIASVIALIALVHSLRQWVSAKPAQLYDEAQQLNASKSKAARQAGRSSRTGSAPWNKAPLVGLAGCLLAFGCLLYVKQAEFWSLPSPARYFAAVQVIGTSGMLGVALFLCVELTMISTPDALNTASPANRIHWSAVSSVALLFSLLLVAACLAQFLQPTSTASLDADDRLVHVAARIFGLMLLLATFVVWMVPRRLANYQRNSSIPRDWVSLTLTAWLGMLAFLVVATLPAHWPWRVLIK